MEQLRVIDDPTKGGNGEAESPSRSGETEDTEDPPHGIAGIAGLHLQMKKTDAPAQITPPAVPVTVAAAVAAHISLD